MGVLVRYTRGIHAPPNERQGLLGATSERLTPLPEYRAHLMR
jgi:hypothetical protein